MIISKNIKEKIKDFKWDGSGENVVEININEFIPEFLIYKQLLIWMK